jgi:hypothetical protein
MFSPARAQYNQRTVWMRRVSPADTSRSSSLNTPVHQRWLHWYDDAEVAGPPTYFGYVGYEHSGRLFSPAVTVIDIPGATPRSTQSNSSASRSQPLGTGATASG